MSRKIAITGACGFIGSNLTRAFVEDGCEVVLIDNFSNGYIENVMDFWDNASMRLVAYDVRRDVKGLVTAFKDVDCVYHMAGLSALPVCQADPCVAYAVNTAGTANVLEAARRAEVRRVIFSSTGAIYENSKKWPCKEDQVQTPSSIYSMTKQAAENVCASYIDLYGMEVVVLRYFNVYGPNQDIKRVSPPFTGYVIHELLAGRRPILHSDGNQRRDYVYIDDVVDMNMRCVDAPLAPGSTFNVCSGETYSVNELYALIAAELGCQAIVPEFRDSALFWDKYPELFMGTHSLSREFIMGEVNKYTFGSNEQALKLLGWSPTVGIEEGIRKCVRSFRHA